ncbi:hypothetical protein KUTeg_017274 [Tegillarca granosa]|uniref:Uncharacterized protein n=1 Tax=Tegillarca granosa TaxID=220873 RepID=A0ABQ9EPK2_TEGGR|nr:hypothetical protein KUTeg_017274 [Tegillarca granosa]
MLDYLRIIHIASSFVGKSVLRTNSTKSTSGTVDCQIVIRSEFVDSVDYDYTIQKGKHSSGLFVVFFNNKT